MSFVNSFPVKVAGHQHHSFASSASPTTLETGSIFKEILDEYRGKLNKEELDIIIQASDSGEVIKNLHHDVSPSSQKARRLAEIISGLKQYSDLFALIGAVSPELSISLWGSIELISKKSNDRKEWQDATYDILHEFCVLAPRLQSYETMFSDLHKPEIIQVSLAGVYRAILDFFYELNQWIKNCPKGFRRLVTMPQANGVAHSLKKIKIAQKVLENEIPVASLALHREWQKEIKEMLTKITTRAKGTLPCRIVPYPSNPRFVGRTTIIQKIKDCLDVTSIRGSVQCSFALHGIGGVGKTQIALRYIYDHFDEYPAVFWVTADSHAKLSQSYVLAAKQLQIEPAGSTRDPDTIIELFKSWLGDSGVRWIIVFDNADDLGVLKKFWPPTRSGSILISSRDPGSALMTKSSAHVTSMTPEEGLQLFRLTLNSSATAIECNTEANSINEVTKKLGYLPLAIGQAASFITETGCAIDDFIEIYNESLNSESTFAGLDTDSVNLFYEHSLATVWRISIERLSSESITLLSILSCLDPDGIPETIIRDGARATVDLKHLSSAVSYNKAVKELLRNGLIWKTIRQPGDNSIDGQQIRSVALHRLVQETVFRQQAAEGKNKTLSKAVEICLNVFPHPTRSNFRLMSRWPECQRCLPHVLVLNSRYCEDSSLIPDACLAELFLYAAWYLYERRAPEVAMPLLKTARRVYDGGMAEADWFLQSRILSAFGCVLFECSHYQESEDYFRQALAIRLNNVAADDILLAHGYQDTALPVSGQGRFQEALELQRKALDIISLNDDEFTRRDMTFHVHHNMARTYEASGNAAEGLRLHFHQGDEFGNGLRTEMSESGAVNLYAIGNCHLALGNREKGIQYHSRALKIRLSLVGERGFYYGISLHKMGCILQADSQFEAALEAFQTTENIFSQAHEAHRELSRTLYRMSVVERLLDKVNDADKHRNTAWELRSALTGETPTTLADQDETNEFDKLVIYIHA